jgi:cell division protein FtsB
MFSYSGKIFPAFLVVLLIFLQYRLWFQTDGVLDMLQLKHKLNIEMQEFIIATGPKTAK